jgi:hypothetical protein
MDTERYLCKLDKGHSMAQHAVNCIAPVTPPQMSSPIQKTTLQCLTPQAPTHDDCSTLTAYHSMEVPQDHTVAALRVCFAQPTCTA